MEVMAFVIELVLELRGAIFPLVFLSEHWPLPVWEEVSEGQLHGSSLLNIRLGYQKINLLGMTARTPSLAASLPLLCAAQKGPAGVACLWPHS